MHPGYADNQTPGNVLFTAVHVMVGPCALATPSPLSLFTVMPLIPVISCRCPGVNPPKAEHWKDGWSSLPPHSLKSASPTAPIKFMMPTRDRLRSRKITNHTCSDLGRHRVLVRLISSTRKFGTWVIEGRCAIVLACITATPRDLFY
jgi:hypothetical protein